MKIGVNFVDNSIIITEPWYHIISKLFHWICANLLSDGQYNFNVFNMVKLYSVTVVMALTSGVNIFPRIFYHTTNTMSQLSRK